MKNSCLLDLSIDDKTIKSKTSLLTCKTVKKIDRSNYEENMNPNGPESPENVWKFTNSPASIEILEEMKMNRDSLQIMISQFEENHLLPMEEKLEIIQNLSKSKIILFFSLSSQNLNRKNYTNQFKWIIS